MPDNKYVVSDTTLTAIADAIREKGGTSESLSFPDGFVDAIEDIPTGGGGTYQEKTGITPTTSSQTITADEGYDALSSVQINAMPSGTAGTPTAEKGAVSNHSVNVTPSVTNTTGHITGGTKTGTPVNVAASELVSGTKSITANGTGIDVTNYAAVDVAVPAESPTLQSKSKTYTPTESQQTESIAADSGYDGLSGVNVTVNAVPSSYVGSGITRRSSSDLSASGAAVTVPAGYYESAASTAVASGTAGTPVATKGNVSNHAVEVTPSVTNTAGYIPGETKTGTPVTVSASELVSGSETKTANGTYDVTNLAELIVNVSGGGGGASNLVTGTFTGTTTGAAMDVTLNYSGSGYPVAVMVYIDGGPSSNSTYNSLVQRYVMQSWIAIKEDVTTTPDFTDTTTTGINACMVTRSYKNSTSSSASYGTTMSHNTLTLSTNDAGTGGSSGNHVVHIKSKTKMSVFIAASSYGFAANITYKYWVLYSS